MRSTSALRSAFLGMAVGAAAGYLLDPDNGKRRRDELVRQVKARARDAREELQETATVMADQAQGAMHELRTDAERAMPENDQTLVQKVRSEVLGAPEWSDYTINVDAAQGAVTLRGQVEREDEINALEEAVRAVPGVRAVTNLLHLPGAPAPPRPDAAQ